MRSLEAQYGDSKSLHGKAPGNAKRVGRAKQRHAPPADDDRSSLKDRDERDDPIGCTVFPMRLAEPSWHDAVFGDTIEHAVRTYDGRIDGCRKDQNADQNHEGLEAQLKPMRSKQDHGNTADEVILDILPLLVRN